MLEDLWKFVENSLKTLDVGGEDMQIILRRKWKTAGEKLFGIKGKRTVESGLLPIKEWKIISNN